MSALSVEKVLKDVSVLCVDDNPDHLLLLRRLFALQGALVTTCNSAEEAIECLVDSCFDVVVSDLSMPPGLTGYDLAHALREIEAENPFRKVTPAIAVSSDAMRPSRQRRFADFQVYVSKPFDRARLVHVVDRLVAADSDVVALGSLDIWEAKQSTESAVVKTEAAAAATAHAAEVTFAAVVATSDALKAMTAAAEESFVALEAEVRAATASARAPEHQ